jgi:hypothetical protein
MYLRPVDPVTRTAYAEPTTRALPYGVGPADRSPFDRRLLDLAKSASAERVPAAVGVA